MIMGDYTRLLHLAVSRLLEVAPASESRRVMTQPLQQDLEATAIAADVVRAGEIGPSDVSRPRVCGAILEPWVPRDGTWLRLWWEWRWAAPTGDV
jgi:hypothetical protein